MLEGIESIFQKKETMTKGLKKLLYQSYTEEFIRRNGEYFEEMCEYVRQSDDKHAAAKEIGDCIVQSVKRSYRNKRGKIDARTQSELNLFMVYYVFPTILKQEEYGKLIADGVLEAWRAGFHNDSIQYADYDTLYHGFKEKILGLF